MVMNRLAKYRRGCVLASIFLLAAASALAAPRYTDRENALAMAEALQNGIFRENLINSTFIQSIGGERYFIKVVLDNGTSQDWTLDQIHTWSKAEVILLQGNRVLIFPADDTNEFVILDKNEFARAAITARVYAKRHKGDDPLAGTTIHYVIRGFNLADLLGLSPGRDAHGYRYHYVLDLMNGQREFLSYLDAYEALERGGMIAEPDADQAVMEWPYRLRKMVAHEVGRQDKDGIARFAVELVFDRPVLLEPEHFPVQVFESSVGQKQRFVLEVTVPNSELGAGVSSLGPVEYLNSIHARADLRHQKRILLQAQISPEVLEFPPEIAVEGNSVLVKFLKVVDQTVLSRRALLIANLRRQQELLLARRMTDEQRRKRREYIVSFEAGFAQMDKARSEAGFDAKITLLTTALANFREAGLSATTDEELQDSLRQRNALRDRIPLMIADHVRARMTQPPILDRVRLRQHIGTAAALTRDLDVLRVLREFLRRLEP